jgi:hypothetical protein
LGVGPIRERGRKLIQVQWYSFSGFWL